MIIKIEDCACPCCKENKINPVFLKFFNEFLLKNKLEIKLTSAYRCEKHNAKVNGSPKSLHLLGYAIDFVPVNMTVWSTFNLSTKWGFSEIILYVNKNVIHVGCNFKEVQRCILLDPRFFDEKAAAVKKWLEYRLQQEK